MGIGDEIMASGRARVLHETTGKKVVIVDRRGQPRWHPIWNGVSFLERAEGSDTVRLGDAPGIRPYIAGRGNGCILFNQNHRATPGSIAFTLEQTERAKKFFDSNGPYVIIEPHVKGTNSADNKDWGWSRWLALSDSLRKSGVLVIQFKYENRPPLCDEIIFVEDTSFHDVAAHIASALCVVTSEGGYHHAAAAVGTLAVVIWGGYTSPKFLGYCAHRNIYHEHPDSPCGRGAHCKHCRERMAEISVQEVYDAVMSTLDTGKT